MLEKEDSDNPCGDIATGQVCPNGNPQHCFVESPKSALAYASHKMLAKPIDPSLRAIVERNLVDCLTCNYILKDLEDRLVKID